MRDDERVCAICGGRFDQARRWTLRRRWVERAACGASEPLAWGIVHDDCDEHERAEDQGKA